MSSGSSEVSGAVGDLDGGGVEEDSVGRYLADLASAAPAPGGGSAAALAAALGAALVAMTCRVTAKHAGAAHAGAAPSVIPLEELAEKADGLRHRLTALANDDSRVYSDVIAARRLPVPEREPAVQHALERATEVPQRLAAESRSVLALCERIAPCARASTLSDLGVAAILAHGALRAGALTARTNLAGIVDGDFTGEMTRRLDALVAEGTTLSERIATALAARGARAS
jgi:formiminotetrahydrofolate cyclodeaminase